MFSLSLARLGAFPIDSASAMLDAVSLVAQRNFFATVERCDPQTFDARGPGTGRWLAAEVAFSEIDLAGSVSCELPEHLADALFDAFIGRGPFDPPPAPEAVHHLMGEFVNMVCGVWLAQVANRRSFTLGRPVVRRVPFRGLRLCTEVPLRLLVNDQPLAVHVRAGAATAGSGAGLQLPA